LRRYRRGNEFGAALEQDEQLAGRQSSLSVMSQVRHRLYLSAVGLAGVWAVASLVRSASDFSAANYIGTPAKKSTSASGFDHDRYLRRKGIDADELMTFAQERTSERQAIARSRALWDVVIALAPLLVLLGVHRWLKWPTRPPKQNA
jgi:hypothetical protein